MSILQGENEEKKRTRIPFRSFLSLFPELSPANNPWKLYYSDQLYNSLESRRAFANPDKSPLPNYFPKRETSDGSLSEFHHRPSASLLSSVLEKITSLLYISPDDPNQHLSSFDDGEILGLSLTLNDEEFTQSLISGKIRYLCHFSFLRLIFCTIKTGWENGDRGTIAIAKIVDYIESYFSHHINDHQESKIDEDLLNYFRSKSIQFTKEEETILLDFLGHREEYREYWGYTFTHFWIQMVIASMVEITHFNPNLLSSFAIFLLSSPELMWYQLWNLYYSKNQITTPEAKAIVVPPDIHKLPSYLNTHK